MPGLDVNVEADNAAPPEYSYEDEVDCANEDDASASPKELIAAVTKCLGMPSGAEFSVRWVMKEPFDAALQTYASAMLGGSYLIGPLRETGDEDDVRGFMCRKTMLGKSCQAATHSFHFWSSRSVSQSVSQARRPLLMFNVDYQPHPTEGLKRQLERINTITVYVYFVISEQETFNLYIPRLEYSQLDPMSENMSQKCASLQGDVLTHQGWHETRTSHREPRISLTGDILSELQLMPSSSMHDLRIGNAPFASYTFHYRSTRAYPTIFKSSRKPN